MDDYFNMLKLQLLKMLPFLVVALPIYLAIRFLMLKKRKGKINYRSETALFAFVLFSVGLAAVTVVPTYILTENGPEVVKVQPPDSNFIPFMVIYNIFDAGAMKVNLFYFLGNILMFIPLGFFISLLWNTSQKKVVFIGFSVSLFIEIFQIFIARQTDIDDLILNTLGTYLGVLLYKFLFSKFKEKIANWRL